MDHLRAKEKTLRVQLKVNLFQSMIWCHKYFGQGIFWSHKNTQYCIKIIRAQCYLWKNGGGL